MKITKSTFLKCSKAFSHAMMDTLFNTATRTWCRITKWLCVLLIINLYVSTCASQRFLACMYIPKHFYTIINSINKTSLRVERQPHRQSPFSFPTSYQMERLASPLLITNNNWKRAVGSFHVSVKATRSVLPKNTSEAFNTFLSCFNKDVMSSNLLCLSYRMKRVILIMDMTQNCRQSHFKK